MAGYGFVLNDHTFMPTATMRGCRGLHHVIFLGTGARSYMDPEALAELGIHVHTIKGYGDTAMAEHVGAPMLAAARKLAQVDRGMRAGQWMRTEGMHLTGKTIDLIGFCGIAAKVASIASGSGMTLLEGNRTSREVEGVVFAPLEKVLQAGAVILVHLLLTYETRDFLDADRLETMRRCALLVNTARGAGIDEASMVAALRSGAIGHAGLDVFDAEPLQLGHVLTTLENMTLSAHSASWTK